jgi:hypothetical protein
VTTRRWDPQAPSKEIDDVWSVCEQELKVGAVAVSRDGRWIVTGGYYFVRELKDCEVETGIVRKAYLHNVRNWLVRNGNWRSNTSFGNSSCEPMSEMQGKGKFNYE